MQKYKNGEFVFDLWKKETENYRNKLAAILKAIEKLDKTQVDRLDLTKARGKKAWCSWFD
jgi:Flp pilus assembly CpaE family ATPase